MGVEGATYRVYRTTSILKVQKHCDGGWFWNKYSAHPYRGCEYGCQYCYARDERYAPSHPSPEPGVQVFHDSFSEDIRVKEDAPGLLRRALRSKPRDLIYLDGYQPVEAKYRYARGMLEVCLDLGYPVFINEKSPLLLRDLDVLARIAKISHLNVGWSLITTRDDATIRVFEPKAPPASARLAAMRVLAEKNVLTGTVFMPILPYIYDTEENIEEVVKATKDHGGRYIVEGVLTLHGTCKTVFYEALRRHDPGLVARYDDLYRDPELLAEHTRRIHRLVLTCCRKHSLTPYIPRPLGIYPENLQVNRGIAGDFYLKARELQVSGGPVHLEWAYRKAAWSLDELEENVEEIYRRKGLDGVRGIRGVGRRLAGEVEQYLRGRLQRE